MPSTSNPGTPAAIIVGTPGTSAVGSGLVTANAFNLPDLTWGSAPFELAKTSCTSCPNRAPTDEPVLYSREYHLPDAFDFMIWRRGPTRQRSTSVE